MCFRAENVTAHLSLSRAGVRADSMKNNVTTARASERKRKGERFQENASATGRRIHRGGRMRMVHREGRYPRGERGQETRRARRKDLGARSRTISFDANYSARTENGNAPRSLGLSRRVERAESANGSASGERVRHPLKRSLGRARLRGEAGSREDAIARTTGKRQRCVARENGGYQRRRRR